MKTRLEDMIMIRQPERENRNVNELSYENEKHRIEKMNKVLGEVELTRMEENTLIWLAGWEESTVDNLLSIIEKVARKRAYEVGGYAHNKSVYHDSSSIGR